jgi:hypothetical protein
MKPLTPIVIYVYNATLDVLKKEGRIMRKIKVKEKEKVIKMVEELPEDITVSDKV